MTTFLEGDRVRYIGHTETCKLLGCGSHVTRESNLEKTGAVREIRVFIVFEDGSIAWCLEPHLVKAVPVYVGIK